MKKQEKVVKEFKNKLGKTRETKEIELKKLKE